MDITLSQPQSDFYTSEEKVTGAVAGFGSGKTDVAMFRMISSAIEYPEGDWLYTAPTIPLIRDILWSKLEDFLPQIGIKYTINKAESIVYLYGLGKIFCRSMDSPDRLVGFQVVDAFLDELDILNKEKAMSAFRKIKARCRMKVKDRKRSNGVTVFKRNQQWITTTPEGFRATYEILKKNPAPSTCLVQMSTYSNAHNLPEDYIDDLKASYPPQLIEAYLNGEFVNLNALGVWVGYDTEKNNFETEIIPGEVLHIGQDFNVGRGCAVVYVFRTIFDSAMETPLNAMVAVGEVVDSFDTPDTIRALGEKFPFEKHPTQIIYPDASGTNRKSVNASISDISLMQRAGYRIKKLNKNPSIIDRVKSTNAAFCNGGGVRKLFLDIRKVPNFSEALQQQAYDKNGLPEKGLGMLDDITDAGSYPVYYHFPIRHNKIFTTTVGGL